MVCGFKPSAALIKITATSELEAATALVNSGAVVAAAKEVVAQLI